MISASKTYRAFAFLLAILVFCTSMSYTVDAHYCRGELKSVRLFGKAKNCHEEAKATRGTCCQLRSKMSEEKKSCALDKKRCCENQTRQFQSDQAQDVQQSRPDAAHSVQFCSASLFAVFSFRHEVDRRVSDYLFYKPPLLRKNIPVLVQSFLF